jgi:hypothetical protein
MSVQMGKRRDSLTAWYHAILQYAYDNDDRLPPAENWYERCEPYAQRQQALTLGDPVSHANPGIAFNVHAGECDLNETHRDLILLAIGRSFPDATTDGSFRAADSILVMTLGGTIKSIHSTNVRWRPAEP